MPSASEALVVQVTGEQFAWNIHYPGPDGKFGRTDLKLLDLQSNPLGLDRDDPAAKDDVTTLNQMHLPANKPVIVRLRSKDVIHSFGVPEFRVKQDAIPGLTIPIWFIPNVTTAEMRAKTGNAEFQYEIACAQLCGLGHARMRGSSPSRPPRNSRSGWRSRSRSRARRIRSADRRGRARPPSRDALRRPRRAGPTIDQLAPPSSTASSLSRVRTGSLLHARGGCVSDATAAGRRLMHWFSRWIALLCGLE